MSCVRASDALAHSILLESRIGKDYSCHPPTSCPVYNIPFFFFNCMRLHQTVQHLTATYHFFLVCPALVVLTPFTVFGLSSTIRPPFVRIMPPPPFFFLSTRTPSEVTHFNVPSSLSLYYSHFFPPQCNNDNKANGEKGRRGTAAKLGHPFTSVYCFACAWFACVVAFFFFWLRAQNVLEDRQRCFIFTQCGACAWTSMLQTH